jgi:hypothetical protein
MAGSPEALEWPFTLPSAAKVAAGPGGVAVAGLLAWVSLYARPRSLVPTFYERLFREAPGRWIIMAASVALLILALLVLVAAIRKRPALRLDDVGITAWSELRLRRIPWAEVAAIGPTRGVGSADVLLISTRTGKVIRVPARIFEESLSAVTRAIRDWLPEHQPQVPFHR